MKGHCYVDANISPSGFVISVTFSHITTAANSDRKLQMYICEKKKQVTQLSYSKIIIG